jgi:hypothetical protein
MWATSLSVQLVPCVKNYSVDSMELLFLRQLETMTTMAARPKQRSVGTSAIPTQQSVGMLEQKSGGSCSW